MIKRIVMCTNGVETLDYFSGQMADTFTAEGVKVFFHDLKNPADSADKLKAFIRSGETAFLTFNFEGLEKEEGIYHPLEGYLWDYFDIPCYNIVADHPYYYHDKLISDERGADLPRRYYHISVDRNHESYMKRFYPEYQSAGFLPLAGAALCEPTVLQTDNMRSDQVLFTANYTAPAFFEPYIHRIDEEYATFYRGIIDDLIANPAQTVEEAALRHCERELGELPDAQLRTVMHHMLFIDLYIRNYWRGEVVKTLLAAGIPVETAGRGWERLECKNRRLLDVHPQTDTRTCLMMQRRAKVSLNVMPWFKDGAHDRVFHAILNGAVSVTDASRYLREELKDGMGLCYYSLKRLDELPGLVEGLLADACRRRDMVESGIAYVREHHTWESRARRLLRFIREDNGRYVL